MRVTKSVLILLAILGIGLFLRVYDLTGESLWLDEGCSIRIAHLNLAGIIKTNTSDYHAPLYFIILHYWINLVGDSEFMVRFLSVIFSFLSLMMGYKFARLIFNRRAGILTALIMAVSLFCIRDAQEARMYGLAVLLALCSMHFFIQLFEKKGAATSIKYLIFTTLLLYTHYSGLFILIIQNVYVISLYFLANKHQLRLKKWYGLQLILLALFMPWLWLSASLFFRASIGSEVFIAPTPSIGALAHPLIFYAGTKFLFVIYLILSALAIIPARKDYRRELPLSYLSRVYLLFLWLCLPIVILFLLAQSPKFFYFTRYVSVSSVAFYLLAAQGIKNIGNKYITAILVVLIAASSLLAAAIDYGRVNRSQWRELARYIDANALPNDLVMFHSGYFQENIFDYYSKRKDLIKRPFPEESRKIPITISDKVAQASVDYVERLQPMLEGHNRIWLILCHSRDPEGLIRDTLKKSYRESIPGQFFDIEVYLFEKT